MVNGSTEEAFRNADHILCGEVRMGGQEHFYLETHCAIAVPKQEDSEMEIFSSCQHPTELQVHNNNHNFSNKCEMSKTQANI